MPAPKRKKGVGRPTKMTPTTVQKLEEAFALGCTDIEACFYAGISKQTLYTYQEKYPDFLDRKEALKESPVLLARKSVVEAIPGDPDLALKYLERKRKDEFSTKQTTEHAGGFTIKGRDITKMSIEELEEELAVLQEKRAHK
jgi:hypothetical protein